MKSLCTSCYSPIEIRFTENGHRVTLDVTPQETWTPGAIVLDGDYGCRSATPMLDAGPYFQPHSAVCRNINQERRGA